MSDITSELFPLLVNDTELRMVYEALERVRPYADLTPGLAQAEHDFRQRVGGMVQRLLPTAKTGKPRTPNRPLIQVIVPEEVQPRLRTWLAAHGLTLFHVPAGDDDLPTFGIAAEG